MTFRLYISPQGSRILSNAKSITVHGRIRETWSTENKIADAFQGLGWDVSRVDFRSSRLKSLLASASQRDIFLTSPAGMGDHRAVKFLRALRSSGVVTVGHHNDLYVGLQRETLIGSSPFFQETDLVFTADGDPVAQDVFEQHGVSHCWLPPAAPLDECYIASTGHTKGRDVLFVGSYPYPHHKVWPYRHDLVKWLSNQYMSRFAVVGGRDAVREHNLNALLVSSKVVVGDSLCPGFRKPYYWSNRVYEVVGRGGFLVMPNIPGLSEHFSDGVQLAFYDFGNFDQLRQIVSHYMTHKDDRMRVVAAGVQHVRDHHTWHHRIQDIIGKLEEVQ